MSTASPIPSKGSRRGFVIELSAAAIVAIGFFVWVLAAIATADGTSDAEKVSGFATMVLYLVVSTSILVGTVRR